MVIDVDGLDHLIPFINEDPHDHYLVNTVIRHKHAVPIRVLVLNDVNGVADDQYVLVNARLCVLDTSTKCLEAVLKAEELAFNC